MKIGNLYVTVNFKLSLWSSIKLRIAGKEFREILADKLIGSVQTTLETK